MNWNTINIRSARMTLKPFTSADADDAFSCITPSLTRFMSWDPPASREEFDQVWRAWLLTIQDGSDFVFVSRSAVDNQFLGLVGLHRAQTENPELGIWIREDRHGNGFGREAVTAVADWASTHLKPSSFSYPVAEQNGASRRIAESLGGVAVAQRADRKYHAVIYQIPPQ
jgi:RimJ/RimL family protein N-acetyltransferase